MSPFISSSGLSPGSCEAVSNCRDHWLPLCLFTPFPHHPLPPCLVIKLPANHRTLVWGCWVCLLSVSLVTDTLATVALIGVKFCIVVHTCLGCVFSPFGGDAPQRHCLTEICPPPYGGYYVFAIITMTKVCGQCICCYSHTDAQVCRLMSPATLVSIREYVFMSAKSPILHRLTV